MKSISTFLLFVGAQAGKAEEAIHFYISLFDDSKIITIQHYGADENEPEGSVKIARFTLGGVEHMASESRLDHQFNFTPAFSFYIECESQKELKTVFEKLADGGKTLMPIDNYGFSRQFGWVEDKYGVSWQLNLA